MNTEGTENASGLFKLKETEEFDKMITEFIKETGASPFTDIQMDEDESNPEIKIDINSDFESEAQKKFENFDDVIQDYITALVMSIIEQKKEQDARTTSNPSEE